MQVINSRKHTALTAFKQALPFPASRLAVAILIGILAPQAATAQSDAGAASDSDVVEVQTIGVRSRLEQAGVLKDTIEKTELVGAAKLEQARAINLTEALQDSPGVDVAVDCSLCGMKRVRLNGMRAEHTTILVDNMPVHTIASGFYGIDAIAMTGVEQIEIARGAGAALLAPEAIGGVVNIVTKDLYENSLELDLSTGELGYRQAGLLGTWASEEADTRMTFIGQFDERDQADEDGNGMSENPYLSNQSLTARITHDLSYTDSFSLRLSTAAQESFGGPVVGNTTVSIPAALASFRQPPLTTATADLFQDADVRKRWSGQPWETTEWVDTDRVELSASWLHEFNPDWNMEMAASWASHKQDSFYEGFDYQADDTMDYWRLLVNHQVGNNHLFTFGADLRNEALDSHSNSGTRLNNDGDPDTLYVSDTFTYEARSAFAQDTWQASPDLEVKLALRLDQVRADFTDPNKPGTEIDESVVSPRVDMRYFHSGNWTSRLSLGRGYRAPLSFFETDHGMLDSGQGFLIDIHALERSKTAVYSLTYDAGKLTGSGTLAWTQVSGLAQLGEVDGVPLLGQKDESAAVLASDISIGYRLNSATTINLVAENYQYDAQFRSVYAIAPVERQISLSVDYDLQGWDVTGTLNWIGSRDLADYAYHGYNRLLPNGYIDESSVKQLDAPAYYVFDTRVSKTLGQHWTVYAGANNLFDYTQARKEDSTLYWVPGERDTLGLQADGFDVVYIHGPLRGRELYLGVKYAF